ncbi:uncharacterized protein LOC134231917 [Saccostrea cucullata]|uniref:uncharacterized protein LOC134231917 n=1 Tax=Saccostrea cuccullata TaxID=36930 RepID=UPI002ECFD2FB
MEDIKTMECPMALRLHKRKTFFSTPDVSPVGKKSNRNGPPNAPRRPPRLVMEIISVEDSDSLVQLLNDSTFEEEQNGSMTVEVMEKNEEKNEFGKRLHERMVVK